MDWLENASLEEIEEVVASAVRKALAEIRAEHAARDRADARRRMLKTLDEWYAETKRVMEASRL